MAVCNWQKSGLFASPFCRVTKKYTKDLPHFIALTGKETLPHVITMILIKKINKNYCFNFGYFSSHYFM
jgi:hypothetical protein